MDKSQRYVVRALFALIIILSSWCAINALAGSNISVNIALIFLTFATLLPLYIHAKRSGFNMFEPIYAYILIFSVFYLFTSVYIYNREEQYHTSILVDIYNDSTNLPVIYVLSFSILLFHLGYNVVTKRIRFDSESFNIEIPQSINVRTIVTFFYIVSVVFRIYGYSVGKMGSLTTTEGFNFPGVSLVYFITNIWYIYFAYFAISYIKNKNDRIFFVFILLFEILIVLISGDRRYIVQIVLMILAVYYYVYKRIPWKLFGILSLFFVFIYLPITTFYGYYLTSGMKGADDYAALISFTFSSLSQMDFDNILSDFMFNPIAESLFALPTLIFPYSQYDLRGIHWGPVGIISLLNNIVPSGILGRINTRQYYESYASDALPYSVEYSPLTFQFSNEVILSFGLVWLPVAFLTLGFLMGLIYKRLFFKDSVSKWMYIGLFFGITYSTNFGLLTTELLTPLRLLLYYLIWDFLFHRKNA